MSHIKSNRVCNLKVKMTRAKVITKKRLKSYYHLSKELEAQMERAARARAVLEAVSASPDAGTRSRKHNDHMSMQIARVQKYERLVTQSLSRLFKEKVYIETAVQKLDDSRQREVIRLRYFNQAEWQFIAAKMGYSMSVVYDLHGKALFRLSNIKE